MSSFEVMEPVQTVKAYLRPIDRTGLLAFADKVATIRQLAAPTRFTPSWKGNTAP